MAENVENRAGGFDAQSYISSRLAGAKREKVVIAETPSRDADEYMEIFDALQQYIVKDRLKDLNESLEGQDNSVLKELATGWIKSHYPRISTDVYALNSLVSQCIDDMTGYGFLNRYFARKDEIEEININGWNTIEVRWCNGKSEITDDKFHNAQHARDVIIRILRSTGKYLDENKIYELSYIGKSVRIATVITPIVDSEIGVAASIRFIHSAVFTLNNLINNGFLTNEMGELLMKVIKHGVSVCVCGATGSGKTTVLNALLEGVPAQTRVITLEGGTREFELIRYDENGKVINNRLHMQTRPHKEERLNVDLQVLLDLVLRFDPDMVVVGEMVSEEAFIASETARTGHTVLTTIHTNNAYDAYYRMFSLGIRKYDLNEHMMLKFMVDAFPIIVYVKKYPDGQRRVQCILEGSYTGEQIEYNELYRFEVDDNTFDENGKAITTGKHVKKNNVTKSLKAKMLDNGATRTELETI